ncbi:MAG: DNA cytosine methyltransferase [Candidatus Hodarchaeota archaeon]
MRLLDLFSGAGGFAHGFISRNNCFDFILAIDIDSKSLETYCANIPNTKFLNMDIRNTHSLDILEHFEHVPPDIIIASPPCESFTLANPNRQKSLYDQLYFDEVGRLILEAIRIIIDLNPKVFIIENVSQLASTLMKEFVLYEFRRSNFETIFFNILEAEKYGVPSHRRRVFISNIEIKLPIDNSFVTVGEAFHSLPDPNINLPNHKIVPLSPRIEKKILNTPPGGAIIFFKGSNNVTFRNYIRLEKSQLSPTVMGKSRFIHPSFPRLCTVRENARLMSYPDNFQFYGSLNSQFNQIGESVPPLLSKTIAQQVLQKIYHNE